MKEWIKNFFSQPNEWDLEKISENGYGNRELQVLLQKILARIQLDRAPLVLPRLDVDKKLSFYIVGKNAQELTEVRGIIAAYLGDTYTSLDPTVHRASNDVLEKIVLGRFPDGFLRLDIYRSVNSDRKRVFWVLFTLNKLVQQFHERPTIASAIRRPTGRILRDFFIAYNHDDYESTLTYFEELKTRQLLSRRNLISLELQTLASGSRWKTLLDHPNLSDILMGYTPRRIVLLILRALNETMLDKDRLEDYDIDDIRINLANIDTLFFRVPDIPKTEGLAHAWKSWSVGAAALGYNRVLDVLPKYLDEEWKNELAKWASLGMRTTVSVQADLTLEALLEEEATQNVAASLLKESLTASMEQAKQVYKKFREYPEEIKEAVLSNKVFRKLWEGLEEVHGEHPEIIGWSDLFSKITEDSSTNSVMQILIEYSDYWLADTWDEKALERLIGESESKNIILRDLLPVMLSWLEANSIKLSQNSIEQILLMLATDEYISIQDLQLCLDMGEMLLESPHTETQYAMLIDVISTCWDKVKSYSSIDGGLEIIDYLIEAPCADPNDRLQLWSHFQETLIKEWARLGRPQKLLAIQYSKEITGTSDQYLEFSDQEIDTTEDTPDLEGKSLAIYTLTEGAGRRAKAVLESIYPGIHIALNHDKTATKALTTLADSVDYFIFSSKSAAHQAFYPVSKRRKDLIYPAGKGATSIVNAFMQSVTRS